MPKISYIPKAKEGFDDAEVTVAQIEQKIADIEALLRGMIDEDNLLSYDDVAVPISIPASNIADMPLETRPVNHSMKLFSSISNNTSIVTTLFDETVTIMNENPFFAIVNGIGDVEIFLSYDGSDAGIKYKTRNVEIPFNYTPLTWGDLWEYVENNNKKLKLELVGTEWVFSDLADLDEFLREFRMEKTDYVFEHSYNMAQSSDIVYKAGVNISDNMMFFSLEVVPDSEEWVYRVVPSILCRVNP